MGRLNITVSDELEGRFRDEVAKILGFKKGNLNKAIEEAIELWIKTKERERKH